MAVGIVKAQWAGASGGPGLSQFAISKAGGTSWTPTDAQSAVNAVRTFFQSLAGEIPSPVQVTVLPEVDVFEETTAVLTGAVTAGTPPTVVSGSATTAYSGGAGFKFDWLTGVIADGRRITGRTYIVPASGVFENNGTLAPTALSSTIPIGSTLLSSLSSSSLALVVWSRPKTVPVAKPGFMTAVASCTIKDKSAIMRSRRD